MIKFNRIISYGCSITSGFELADHLILPTIDEEEIDYLKRKQGIESWLTFLYSKASPDSIISREAELAWPKYIADYFKVDYINRAVPGGNSQSSIFFIEQDLANGIIKDTDLILVGHTEHSRWFWLDEFGTPKHGCIGGTIARWPSLAFHREFVKYVSNDYFLLYQWHHDIRYLDLLSKQLGGRLLQVFCYNTLNDELSRQSDIFFDRYKNNNFNSVLDENYSFNSIVDWTDTNNLHGFGHPRQKFHKEYAQHIISVIITHNV